MQIQNWLSIDRAESSRRRRHRRQRYVFNRDKLKHNLISTKDRLFFSPALTFFSASYLATSIIKWAIAGGFFIFLSFLIQLIVNKFGDDWIGTLVTGDEQPYQPCGKST